MGTFVCPTPTITTITEIGLLSPGLQNALIFTGLMYLVYSWEKAGAKKDKNGKGPLHRFVGTYIIQKGIDYDEYYKGIEDARQRTKDHYELGQRPKYRISYPEYGLLVLSGY